MKVYRLVFFFFFWTAAASAQAFISGKVVDQTNGSAVGYATVTIQDKTSGKLVDGASTDSTGAFYLKKVPYGSYKLSVSFLGYEPFARDNIVLDKTHGNIKLGTLSLKENSHTLNGVTITGTPPIVENKIDKMIYNAANDVTAQGGVALDVLKKVPQVSVDVDGNVELQGNADIRFLINGKPSGILGSSLTDALASIPASQIQSIEVITSPGARYDAQGTGGIINIILKKNKLQGINGSVTMGAGSRMENGAVNLSARTGKIGLNAFFSGNATLRSKSPNSQDRTSFNAADSTYTHLLQDGATYIKRSGYEAGLGFDWNITNADVISTSIQYSNINSNRSGLTNQQEMVYDAAKSPLSGVSSQRNSFSHTAINSLDVGADYKHTFKKDGGELDLSYNASFGNPALQSQQVQNYLSPATVFSGLSNTNSGTNKETNLSLDYSRSLWKEVSLETGIKSTVQRITNNTDVDVLNAATGLYSRDTLQSYNLGYDLHVFAGYVSASFSLGKFLDVKAGLRVEHTNVNIDYKNTSIPSYTTFVPSLTLSHPLSDQQFVKLSYSHRIERPDYEELNPFLNISDPYNITTGNPLLQPEIGDNFELGYSKSFNGGANLYIAAVERINSHDIKPYTMFYPKFTVGDSVYNNVSITNRVNIGKEYNTGLIVSGSAPIGKLDVRGNLMLFNRHIINNLDTANQITNGFNWRLNMNLSYHLSKKFVVEGFGNYRSAFNNIQGKAPQFLTYTLAFKKQILKGKGDIGLTATNFINNYVQQVTTINTADYNSRMIREIPLQSFGISFSYKFGKLELKKEKEHEGLKDPSSEN